jgi:hypothetical protein
VRARTALLVYVGVCGTSVALERAGSEEAFWLIPLASIVVATATRRWWVVLLPAWLPLAGAVFWIADPGWGESGIDSAGSAALFVLVYGALPLVLLTACSVTAAKLVVYFLQRRFAAVGG